mmetsp:Transcript_17214/g.19776  ORF Transcript_17214/g.19776 Transcript_17214/m.19776 type:complete len:87 (-) Transcript_17214:92-352(-)
MIDRFELIVRGAEYGEWKCGGGGLVGGCDRYRRSDGGREFQAEGSREEGADAILGGIGQGQERADYHCDVECGYGEYPNDYSSGGR